MPAVAVPPRPKGLPTAITQSPTRGLAGVLEVDEREAAALDLDHRQVGALVAADHRGLQLGLVLQDDLDVLGVLDDVVVGDDVAVGRDEEARARGLLGGRFGWPLWPALGAAIAVAVVAVALAARDVGSKGSSRSRGSCAGHWRPTRLGDVDRHHGGRDLLEDVGEGHRRAGRRREDRRGGGLDQRGRLGGVGRGQLMPAPATAAAMTPAPAMAPRR